MPTPRKTTPKSEPPGKGQVQPPGAPERLPSSPTAKATPPPPPKPMPTATSSHSEFLLSVKNVTIDVLLRRAFPNGQWAHVNEWLEQQSFADEVRAEIAAAIERNR